MHRTGLHYIIISLQLDISNERMNALPAHALQMAGRTSRSICLEKNIEVAYFDNIQ